jgi:hypothetical protein
VSIWPCRRHPRLGRRPALEPGSIAVLSGLLGLLLFLGCGQDGGSGDSAATATPTTPTPGIATREVTVLEDDTCWHLGDNVDRGICPELFSNRSFARALRRSFTVTGPVTEGRVTLHVADVGPIGGEVRLNGRLVLSVPAPLGAGEASAAIPGDAFRLGTNEFVIRAREDRGVVEDFQVDRIRLVVIVPA